MSQKDKSKTFLWHIYDMTEFIEEYIWPIVILIFRVLMIIVPIWIFWPDFTNKNTIYSYSLIQTNCPSKQCEYEFKQPTIYRIDTFNRMVNFKTHSSDKDLSQVFSYKNCKILDKKNWSCGYPIKMNDGIMNIAPNAQRMLENSSAELIYLPKWKWKLKKIERFLLSVLKH